MEKENYDLSKKSSNVSVVSDTSTQEAHKQLKTKYTELEHKYNALLLSQEKSTDYSKLFKDSEIKYGSGVKRNESGFKMGSIIEKELLTEFHNKDRKDKKDKNMASNIFVEFDTFKDSGNVSLRNNINAEIEKLKDIIIKLEEEKKVLTEKFSAFQYQSEASEMNIFNTLKEKNLEISELIKKNGMINEEMQNMEYENEELKQIIEGYKEEINKLSKENNLIVTKMKEFEENVNNLSKNDKESENVKQSNKECIAENEQLRSELENMANDNDNLKTENEVLKERIEEQKEEIMNIKENINDTKENNNEQYEIKLEETREEYEEEINRLNSLIEEIKKTSDNSEEINKLNEEIDNLKDYYKAKLKETEVKLSALVDQLNSENESLLIKVTQLEAKHTQEMKKKNKEISDMSYEANESTSKINQLENYVEENRVLNNQINKLKTTIERIEKEKKDLQSELDFIKEELADKEDSQLLKEELNDCKETIEELHNKIAEYENDKTENGIENFEEYLEEFKKNINRMDYTYNKNINSYIGSDDWLTHEERLNDITEDYEKLRSSKKFSKNIKFKKFYNNLKDFIIDEKTFFNTFNKLEIENNTESCLDLVNSILFLFSIHYNELKSKVICLANFFEKQFNKNKKDEDTKGIICKESKIDLKEMYLNESYFDGENRDYILVCVEDYVKMKFAAKKIQRFFRQLTKEKKKEKNTNKNVEQFVFGAGTGKMVLIETLERMENFFEKFRDEL